MVDVDVMRTLPSPYSYYSSFLLVMWSGASLLELGQDLALSEEVVGVFADLHFGAAVLRKEDLVAGRDGEGTDLAVFVGGAGPCCEDGGF